VLTSFCMSGFVRTHAYADRSIQPSGLLAQGGWRLKRYDISLARGGAADDVFADAWIEACGLLPSPAITHDRPGIGFVIRHSGFGADYLVLCWWDNQNELLQRVLVRRYGEPRWSDGTGRFSICVWDLQVIWYERNAFVKHVLSQKTGPDLQAYVADFMPAGAAG
jgi:hypothetical protein